MTEAASDEATAGPGLPIASAAYLNSFKNFTAHASSTGLRTAQLRYAMAAGELSNPALEFLLNSRYRRGDREFEISVQSYFDDAALTMVSQVGRRMRKSPETFALPTPLLLPMALHEVIARRRSNRTLSGEPLKLAALATILQCAAGITATATTELKDGTPCSMPLRAAPSGGGLYPIDLHLTVRDIPGLAPGLYDFLPLQDALARIETDAAGDEAVRSVMAALPGDFVDIRRASAFLVFSVSPWRSMRKYGQRGLRFALMETGYIAENVHLASTALGCASCDYGGFYDDELNRAFGFDGHYQTAIHAMVLGG